MTDERWSELLDQIERKFGILKHQKEEIAIKDDFGIKGRGELETVIFNGPLGKMKLEREKRPKILQKKVHYAKTQASGAQIEYLLSENETTQKIRAFRWNDEENNWTEINISKFSF